jgi:glycosyltransferase involved in cell wall biosynthesis
MKRILVIGHDASRTGAPIVLLHFLRWLAARDGSYDVDLLLLGGGPLEEEYRKVANVRVVPQKRAGGPVSRRIAQLRRGLGLKVISPGHEVALFSDEYDVALGNTVATLEHLNYFGRRGSQTVLWQHELETVIGAFYARNEFVELAAGVDRIIVASRAVERMLREFGVGTRTHLVYEFSGDDAITGESAAEVRARLGIPPDAFVAAGSGTVEHRKGTDLFLKLAAKCIRLRPDIYFLWVGGHREDWDREFSRVRSQFDDSASTRRVIFTGAVVDPHSMFAASDVFALTSREDPFPLVCLEAAALKKPIACFADAGGMPEFVEKDAGAVVPFCDTDAMANAIGNFYQDRDLLEAMGARAAEKIRTKFSKEKSCAEIERILMETAHK